MRGPNADPNAGSSNAKGYVPMLELDDGQRLTEGVAIVQYIADQAPDQQLARPTTRWPVSACRSGCTSSAANCTRA